MENTAGLHYWVHRTLPTIFVSSTRGTFTKVTIFWAVKIVSTNFRCSESRGISLTTIIVKMEISNKKRIGKIPHVEINP